MVPWAVGVVSLQFVLCMLGLKWVWPYAVSDKGQGRGGNPLISGVPVFRIYVWLLVSHVNDPMYRWIK